MTGDSCTAFWARLRSSTREGALKITAWKIGVAFAASVLAAACPSDPMDRDLEVDAPLERGTDLRQDEPGPELDVGVDVPVQPDAWGVDARDARDFDQEAIDLPFIEPSFFLADSVHWVQPTYPWGPADWNVSPDVRIVRYRATDFLLGEGVVISDEVFLTLEPGVTSGVIRSPRFDYPPGPSTFLVPLWADTADAVELALDCDGERVFSTTSATTEVLPDDSGGGCAFEVTLRSPRWSENTFFRGVDVIRAAGALDWTPTGVYSDDSSRSISARRRVWIAARSGSELGVVSTVLGASFRAVGIDPLPASPLGQPALAVLDDHPVLFTTVSGGRLFGARYDPGAGRFGDWVELISLATDVPALAPVGTGILALDVDCGLWFLTAALEGTRVGEIDNISCSSPRAAVALDSVSVAFELTGPEQHDLVRVSCPDGCDNPVVSEPVALGTDRTEMSWLPVGSALLAVARLASGDRLDVLSIRWSDEGLSTLELLPAIIEDGTEPQLGYLGNNLLVVFADADGRVLWTRRSTVQSDTDWSVPRVLSDVNPIRTESLARAQAGADFLLVARDATGELYVRNLSRSLTRDYLDEVGIEPGYGGWPLGQPEWGLEPEDFRVYGLIAPAFWAWPESFREPLLSPTVRVRVDLCLQSCSCGVTGCSGFEVALAAPFQTVVHEIGHSIASRLSAGSYGQLAQQDVSDYTELMARACTDEEYERLAPEYEVDGERHIAGFSPAGSYYDCVPVMGDYPDHHFINAAMAYLSEGTRLRTVMEADFVSTDPDVATWGNLLRDKYRWLEQNVFGTQYQGDGVPCWEPTECGEAPNALAESQ